MSYNDMWVNKYKTDYFKSSIDTISNSFHPITFSSNCLLSNVTQLPSSSKAAVTFSLLSNKHN